MRFRGLWAVVLLWAGLGLPSPAAAQQLGDGANYSIGRTGEFDSAATRRVQRGLALLNKERSISEYTTPYQHTRYYGFGMYRPWIYEPHFLYWYGTDKLPYQYYGQ